MPPAPRSGSSSVSASPASWSLPRPLAGGGGDREKDRLPSNASAPSSSASSSLPPLSRRRQPPASPSPASTLPSATSPSFFSLLPGFFLIVFSVFFFCLWSGYLFLVMKICSFEIKGYVAGFGNPDWKKTHEPASRTAVVVSMLLKNGASCVGRTVMDELAYGSVCWSKWLLLLSLLSMPGILLVFFIVCWWSHRIVARKHQFGTWAITQQIKWINQLSLFASKKKTLLKKNAVCSG